MGIVRRNAATTDNEIIIDWDALVSPDNGDSAILAYNLQWDQGSAGAEWYDLYGVVPSEIDTTFLLTSEITAGSSYLFRVRAQNIHGWGAFSGEVSIKAAGIADQVDTVTTSIDPATGGVLIEWTAPHDGSQDITEYLVEIGNADSTTWNEEAVNCSGDEPSLTSCIVPMDVFVAGPFDLAFDQLVVVRVTAINFYGSSTPSVINTVGAQIRQKPDQMANLIVIAQTES